MSTEAEEVAARRKASRGAACHRAIVEASYPDQELSAVIGKLLDAVSILAVETFGDIGEPIE